MPSGAVAAAGAAFLASLLCGCGEDSPSQEPTPPGVVVSTPAQPELRVAAKDGALQWEVAPLCGVEAQTRRIDLPWKPGAQGVEAVWTATNGTVLRTETYELPDYDAFVAQEAERRDRIAIPFEMPADGKATIAIDTPDGRRVRNLLKGIPYPAGRHEAVWDGYAEDGTLVTPGDYRVRIVTHPGLSYEYVNSFGNGGETEWMSWGPNHTAFCSLVARDGLVSASALFTEGGKSTVVMDADGHKLFGLGEGWSFGNDALFHVDGPGDRYYSLREAKGSLQCFAYDWRNPGKPRTRLEGAPETHLAGAAAIGTKIFVSNRASSTIDVYDLDESGHESVVTFSGERRAVPFAGPLASHGHTLVQAFSTNQYAIATDGSFLYALEHGSHQVHVYDLATKKPIRVIGEPGGPYVGPWRKNRLVRPTSLCYDGRGKLWITEQRFAPKRISRWDIATGECEIEKFGGEHYGTPGGGMDSADRTRWIAHDCLFSVDWETGRERIAAVLLPMDFDGTILRSATFTHYTFLRRAGRTFVMGLGMCPWLFELRDDRLVPLALFGNTHRFILSTVGDNFAAVHPAFLAACRAAFPDNRESDSDFLRRMFNDQETGVFWKDLNRDEALQADEFQVVPEAKPALGYWGFYPESLDFSVPATEGSGYSVLRFDAGPMEGDSLPGWDLAKAFANRARCPDPLPRGQRPSRAESFADTHGRAITLCTSPFMMAFGRDGRLEWHMDNPFPGVHGAQKADLPRPGELQGLLFEMGLAPFSGDADVFATINDHGRVFFITTDGIYLDELFSDCRVSARNDETLIGGEAFGGSFHRDEASGDYVFSAGGGGYRRYVIRGLDQVRETRATLQVSPRQVAAAERNPPAAATTAGPASATFPGEVEWATGNSTVKVRVSRVGDGAAYRIRWEAMDGSPWVNNGLDPYLMFKTGDCVDFQFIGRDGLPARLQVSPKAGAPDETQVTFYRHSAGTGPGMNPHDFSSPWRTHHVDDVRFPGDIPARVQRGGESFAVELDVPASLLPDGEWTCDFGVIYGDDKGEINLSRFYWSNKETGLVNDVPGEIIPQPSKWGTARIAGEEGAATAAIAVPAEDGAPAGEMALRFAGYLSNPHGALANPDSRHGPHGAGPVWDPDRQLLTASAGQGKVRTMRLDGAVVAEYDVPGNPSWGRFDTMVRAENGDIFFLAGGNSAARAGAEQAKVWRIPAGAPAGSTPEMVAENVLATSANVHDGILMLARAGGALSAFDTRTLAETPWGRNTYRTADSYPCMYDWLPDGGFFSITEHYWASRYGDDGVSLPPFPFFGDRELSVEIGRVIGDRIWCLYGETIKRYDARDLRPAPGVVIGGASGYFLGRVVREYELNARGICEIGDNLFAVLSACNSAIYILRYDARLGALVKVRRLGGIRDPANLAIDADGLILADNIVWPFDAEPLAPPARTVNRMPQRATAVLPTGFVSDIQDTHGARVEFWTGRLSGELAVRDYGTDSRPAPDIEHIPGQPQRWSETPFDVAVLPVADSAPPAYDIVAVLADGTRKFYRVDGAGRPVRGGDWFREEKGEPRDPDRHEARDGALLAVTSTSAGTLTVYWAVPCGALYPVAEVGGLSKPTRVALNNRRIVVFESGAQRLSRYVLEEKR